MNLIDDLLFYFKLLMWMEIYIVILFFNQKIIRMFTNSGNINLQTTKIHKNELVILFD